MSAAHRKVTAYSPLTLAELWMFSGCPMFQKVPSRVSAKIYLDVRRFGTSCVWVKYSGKKSLRPIKLSPIVSQDL